ncbi:hypothetical protein LZ30DRAFT_775510 [Colletotrichum cereale]|nr:hypothetical protein LZ30DRAFT_775510 [Colletotrichum cereale]
MELDAQSSEGLKTQPGIVGLKQQKSTEICGRDSLLSPLSRLLPGICTLETPSRRPCAQPQCESKSYRPYVHCSNGLFKVEQRHLVKRYIHTCTLRESRNEDDKVVLIKSLAGMLCVLEVPFKIFAYSVGGYTQVPIGIRELCVERQLKGHMIRGLSY